MKEPICIERYGRTEWRFNNKLYRTDGPAIEYSDGSNHWWLNDKRHRLDGPAIEWANGDIQWWINGKVLCTKEIEDWIEDNKIELSTDEGKMAVKMRWG